MPPSVAGDADMVRRRCCHGEAAVLPSVAGDAAMARRRCYRRSPEMLPWRGGYATVSRRFEVAGAVSDNGAAGTAMCKEERRNVHRCE